MTRFAPFPVWESYQQEAAVVLAVVAEAIESLPAYTAPAPHVGRGLPVHGAVERRSVLALLRGEATQ